MEELDDSEEEGELEEDEDEALPDGVGEEGEDAKEEGGNEGDEERGVRLRDAAAMVESKATAQKMGCEFLHPKMLSLCLPEREGAKSWAGSSMRRMQ